MAVATIERQGQVSHSNNIRLQPFWSQISARTAVRRRAATLTSSATGSGRVSFWPALSHQVFLGNEAFLAGTYTPMAIAAVYGVHYMTVSRAVKKFKTERGNVGM